MRLDVAVGLRWILGVRDTKDVNISAGRNGDPFVNEVAELAR